MYNNLYQDLLQESCKFFSCVVSINLNERDCFTAGRKPRRKNDSDDDDDDEENIDMNEVKPDTQRVSSRQTTRRKPVLQFSSDDDDDFEQSATKGC